MHVMVCIKGYWTIRYVFSLPRFNNTASRSAESNDLWTLTTRLYKLCTEIYNTFHTLERTDFNPLFPLSLIEGHSTLVTKYD